MTGSSPRTGGEYGKRTSVKILNPYVKSCAYNHNMATDIVWAVSVSLTGIATTTVLLAIINMMLKDSSQNNTKTKGFVK